MSASTACSVSYGSARMTLSYCNRLTDQFIPGCDFSLGHHGRDAPFTRNCAPLKLPRLAMACYDLTATKGTLPYVLIPHPSTCHPHSSLHDMVLCRCFGRPTVGGFGGL